MQTGMWGIIKKIKKFPPRTTPREARDLLARLLLRRLVLQKFKLDEGVILLQKQTESQFYGPNLGYVLDLYERYREDPESVDERSREFFETWSPPQANGRAASARLWRWT